MQYRKYGKTDMNVSLLGLGCMRFPRIISEDGASADVDTEKAFELVRYAADNGVNYFDTAFTYHGSTSENVLGEALEGERRKKVYIATKQPINKMITRDDIRKNLEITLKKLRTDYIDVYLMHNIQGGTWEQFQKIGAIEEYEKFRSEGLIKHIGFSFHGHYKEFKTILNGYDWEMCQLQQNMLDIDIEATSKGIHMAGKKGCAVVIMEPLRGGGLANAPSSVANVYNSYDVKRKPHEWAFRHLVNFPEVSAILSGMTTLEQLKDNIEIFSKSDMLPNCLSAQEQKIISDARAAYQSIVTVPCTGCEYCMPCPAGVGIPEVFSKYNAGNMFGNFDQPSRSYMFTTMAGHDASKCVECGVCKSKCPQFIDIPSQLKVAHEQLKGWVE